MNWNKRIKDIKFELIELINAENISSRIPLMPNLTILETLNNNRKLFS